MLIILAPILISKCLLIIYLFNDACCSEIINFLFCHIIDIFFIYGLNNVNLSPLVIAFQFFAIGAAYLARNIFDGNSGELDNYLSFSVFYVSGS